MRGLFPGRFQPFHRGHRQFVEQIATDVDEIIVGIGSAQASHTGRNPFTAGERISMVRRALEDVDATAYAIPIEDVDRYALWPAHVTALCPPFEAVYTNNPIVDRVCSENDFDVESVELIDRERYRGTEIRRRMVEGRPWRDLVPDATVDGVARLQEVVEHDQHDVDVSP
jgi:nicotinamide-nucleotide adenylyltransferase